MAARDLEPRLHYSVAAASPPAVRWEGYLKNGSGYGEEGRGYLLELGRRGHDLKLETLLDEEGFLDRLPHDDARRLAELSAREPSRDDIVVQQMVPNHVSRGAVGSYHVARTMFETDGLPTSWLPNLAQVDEIWVPTPFNVKTFSAAGVTVPLHVVPAGVDTDLYAPGASPLPLPGTSGTVFLAVAAMPMHARSGFDVMLRAWADAFSSRDDVQLVLKVAASRTGARAWRQTFDRWVEQKLRRPRRTCAPVHVIDTELDALDMPRLYAASSALVAPLRGAGYGRPLLEAMASGLPVISTAWSAMPHFIDADNGYLLDIDGLVEIGDDEPLVTFRGQRWAQPSARHLAELLRSIASDPAAAERAGTRAREDVLAKWTWKHAVDAVEERLTDIRSRITRPARHAGPGPTAPGTRVRWEGEQYSLASLAVVNRMLAEHLVERPELEVELVTPETAPHQQVLASVSPAHLRATGFVHDEPPQVTVRHQWPPRWEAPASGALVVVQPWEFGAVPASWLPGLELADEIWCYTSWVRDCYELSGVPADKLHVMPLGVDTALFRPDGATYPLATRKRRKLLFCGGAIARKGIDVLVRSYLATFSPDDDVCLVVKAHATKTSYADDNMMGLLQALAARDDCPEIELIDEDLSVDQLAALYRSCDVLVHPYRGEGFALPVAEAMASGLPVVVTAGGATRDFCDEENAYLVAGEITEMSLDGQGPSSQVYFWVEPDPASLSEQMRLVVQAPAEELVRRGEAGRRRIVADFSWDQIADVVAARLQRLESIVPVRSRPHPELATASEDTLLHIVTPECIASDDVVTAHLTRAPSAATCLVLACAPQEAEGLLAALRTLLDDLGIAEEDSPEVLLQTCDTDDPGELDALGRITTRATAAATPRPAGHLTVVLTTV